MKSLSNETLKFFIQKALGILNVESKFWMSFANLVAEIQFKLSNERALSIGEPSTCEYVALLQSIHRGTLSIHWYTSQII